MYPGIYYKPFSLFDRFQGEPSQGAETAQQESWSPRSDILETESGYRLWLDLPGVNPQSIDVSVDRQVLTIRGEKAAVDTTENDEWRRLERTLGAFERQFSLPDDVDSDTITAESEHGVLKLELKRTVAAQPRRIEVQH